MRDRRATNGGRAPACATTTPSPRQNVETARARACESCASKVVHDALPVAELRSLGEALRARRERVLGRDGQCLSSGPPASSDRRSRAPHRATLHRDARGRAGAKVEAGCRGRSHRRPAQDHDVPRLHDSSMSAHGAPLQDNPRALRSHVRRASAWDEDAVQAHVQVAAMDAVEVALHAAAERPLRALLAVCFRVVESCDSSPQSGLSEKGDLSRKGSSSKSRCLLDGPKRQSQKGCWFPFRESQA